MRINELEFQDKNGNEINPTKKQMATFIAYLNNENEKLKHELVVKDKVITYFCNQNKELLEENSNICGYDYIPIKNEIRIKNVLEKEERDLASRELFNYLIEKGE